MHEETGVAMEHFTVRADRRFTTEYGYRRRSQTVRKCVTCFVARMRAEATVRV
jgi:hypothetical protein